MNIKITKLTPPKPLFVPIKVELILNTKDEADAFATVTNYSTLVRSIKTVFGVNISELTDAFSSAGADPHLTSALHEAVKKEAAL